MPALRPSRQLQLSWSGKRNASRGKDALFLNQYTCARENSRCVSTMSTASVGRNGKGTVWIIVPLNQHLTDVCFCASTMSTAPTITERQSASCNEYGLNQHTYIAYMHYILTVSISPTIAELWISPLKQRVYVTALRPSRQLQLSRSGRRNASQGKDALFLNQYTCARENSRCVSTMSTASVG